MADETTPTTQPTGTEPATTPAIDPARYAALEEYYNQTQPYIEKIQPYQEDIDRFVTDERARSIAKSGWDAAKSIEDQQKPEVPPWAQELKDENKKLVTYVDQLTQRESLYRVQQRIEKAAESWPELQENNWALVNDLQKEAQGLGVTTLDGVASYIERLGSRFPKSAPKAEPKTAPRSLRGGESIPGASPTTPQFKNNIERRNYMRTQLRKAAGG